MPEATPPKKRRGKAPRGGAGKGVSKKALDMFALVEKANPKVPKHINLKLDEPTWAKLKAISELTSYSMQGFIREHLERAIEREFGKLKGRVG